MIGEAPASTGARSVFCLCAAQVLTMVGVFSFPALLPGFVAEWSLTGADAGWISGATFAGYALAVPFLAALTDRVDAKLVYLGGTLFAAVSVMGFTLAADGFWTAFAWRLLGGVGLAGTYMPGLKALMDRTSGVRQARWISYYTASFSLGTSGSFLVTGAMAGAFGWRAAFGLAAASAAAAFLLVAFFLPSVRPAPPEHKSNPFDFGAVLRNRAAMAYVFGYSSHTWELFGARSWMVAFLSWVLASQPGAKGPSPTAIATIGALLAMVASVVGADLAVRFDRRRLCILAMLGSGAVAAVIGFCGGLPYGAVAALMLLYSVLIQVDSAALTTGALLAADPDRRGATLSVHSLIGFSAGFIGPLAFGIVLDRAGGANTGLAWGLAFASLAAVSALGPLALKRRSGINLGSTSSPPPRP